jgi:hypothetical protein
MKFSCYIYVFLPPPPPHEFWMGETIFMKPDMYIIGIWTLLNGVLHKSPISLCVCITYVDTLVARQQLSKNPLLVLGSSLVKTLLWQWMHAQ